MERELRRFQNNLLISGYAVIAFGIWSILKAVFYVFLEPDYFEGMVGWAELDEFGMGVVYFLIFFLLVIDMLLRLFIAGRAIKEAKGKKTGTFHLYLTGILVLSSLVSLVTVFSPDNYVYSISDTVVSVVVELTSVYIFVELIYSSIMIRTISKKKEA